MGEWGNGENPTTTPPHHNNTPPQNPTTPTYLPFSGICLTDTFQPGERDDLVSSLMGRNSKRRNRQNKLDIRVIMGNPPYSAGQESANDNNQNIAYPVLDERIRETYAAHSGATLLRGLYDSYIRAIRWASDRIGDAGIIGFVTNAGFLEANTADGLRKCLAEEFSNIYVFHLRGNQRTSGELSRKEGGKIFGSGSRAPIAITLLVKNPEAKTYGNIHWHDIGDYLTREQKLEIISQFHSLNGISQTKGWTTINPDAHHDWVNQRDDSFENFIKMGDKKDGQNIQIFDTYSRGVMTCRDSWCYNYLKSTVETKIFESIHFYGSELERYQKINGSKPSAKDFVTRDDTKISWDRPEIQGIERGRAIQYNPASIFIGHYRPFSKQWFYFDRNFNNCVYLMPSFFPTPELENIVISVTGVGEKKGFSSFVSDSVPNLHLVAGGQNFPLYLYEKAENSDGEADLFSGTQATKTESGYRRRDGISDAGLAHFQKAYPGEKISKEDLFYYIYGLLHSPDYRARYADNLSKELPRIPAVKGAEAFWAFSRAGRQLADLHLNYESVQPHPVTLDTGKKALKDLQPADYRVTKMRFGKSKDPATGKTLADKTVILYNPHITLRDIPLEAYTYIVNGKPAIEWVMERQSVTTDKSSQITNDANHYATETLQNPKYPLELLQRIITVSLETMKVVDGLPGLGV